MHKISFSPPPHKSRVHSPSTKAVAQWQHGYKMRQEQHPKGVWLGEASKVCRKERTGSGACWRMSATRSPWLYSMQQSKWLLGMQTGPKEEGDQDLCIAVQNICWSPRSFIYDPKNKTWFLCLLTAWMMTLSACLKGASAGTCKCIWECSHGWFESLKILLLTTPMSCSPLLLNRVHFAH